MNKTFYFVVFALLYFSSRGVLIQDFEFAGIIDQLITFCIRLFSIFYLLYFILIFEGGFQIKKYILIFEGIIFLSFIINQNSFQQFIQFQILVFYPIGFGLILLYKLTNKQIEKLVTLLLLWSTIQFVYSLFYNFDKFALRFIIDDPFNGFFAYPRAYHFSFFVLISTFIYLSKKEKKISFVNYYLPFVLFLTPIISGAGRLIFCFLLSIIISLFIYFWLKNRRYLLYLPVILFVFFLLFEYYTKAYSVTGDLFKEFISNPTQSPKIIYFVKSLDPFLNNPENLIVGFGPGAYMSNASQVFRPDLLDLYNNDLHYENDTDVYQAYNNIIGFLGDLGIVFLVLFYWFYFKIIRLSKDFNLFILIPIVGIFLYSFFFQIFDDPYYSLIVWVFWSIIVKTQIEKKGSYR